MQNSKGDFSETKHPAKNCGEKKPQQNDTQILLNSQENIFQAISAVLTESSQSTNIDEMEESLLQAVGIGNCGITEESHKSASSLGPRREEKQLNKPQKTLNGGTRGKTDNFGVKVGGIIASGSEEMEQSSQESVSMLQECYERNLNYFPELMETCLNSEIEEINIYSDEEIEKLNERRDAESPVGWRGFKVESSTQTASSLDGSSQEKEMMKHSKFISSIIRLKTALSSRKSISEKNLKDIIYSGRDEEREEVSSETHCQSVQKEAIDYLLRTSNVKNVFCETVQILLNHLEGTLRENFSKVACCWKNSVHEMAAEMLIHAVDTEVGVWKMTDRFLCMTIQSILNNEYKSKDLLLESKTNFIIGLCQSTHLSCTAINFIIEKLKGLTIIERHKGHISMTERLTWANLTKNSYYLLRILESALKLVKAKIDEGKIEKVVKKSEVQYYNVLEMWKKQWNRNEVSKEQKSRHDWELMVNGWCKELDEILLHCVNHVPIVSMAVERCGESAKDILKTCHPDLAESRTKTAFSEENWCEF